jgi:hypothetical protein
MGLRASNEHEIDESHAKARRREGWDGVVWREVVTKYVALR